MTESLHIILTISSILLGAILFFIVFYAFVPEFREDIKSRTFRLEFLADISICFIFIYFTTLGLQSTVKSVEDTMWNPYIFGGMPAVLIRQGIRWCNVLNTFLSGQIFYMHKNPIMYCIFLFSIGVFFINRKLIYYILVIIVELLMIFTTDFTNVA